MQPDLTLLLSSLPLFKGLASQDLQAIVAGTTDLHVARDAQIFKQGERCHGFHIVVSGKVKLVFSSEGIERVVRIIASGDSFGEALMFMDKDYIVSAISLEDTRLLHVDKKVLLERLDESPMMARAMLAGLSSRLFYLMGDVESYTLKNSSQRLVSLLLKESRGVAGKPFVINIGKAVLASRINLSAEHFSRLLRELAEAGIVHVKGRQYTILDIDKLREFGSSANR